MGSPLVSVVTLALLMLVTGHDCASSIIASRNPLPVGSNVTLSLSNHMGFTVATWSHKGHNIVMRYPGGRYIFPKWENRIEINDTTMALTIMWLQVNDSGQYQVQTNIFSDSIDLSVQEPISDVTLRTNATNLVEFNDTAFFTCTVGSGTSLSYHWLNGSSELQATEEVQLGDGGSTLTIVSVTRYDQGPFRCNVSNAISDGLSHAIPLNISYGPDDPEISIMPKKNAYKTGSNITLLCSAESNPLPKIQWLFDEQYLDHYSPQLILENVKENQTGSYKCLVHNTVTNRFGGVTANIRIVEPISAVEVKRIGRPAILNDSFILSCEVTGPVNYVRWWKDGQAVTNGTALNMKDMTLTFNPVQHSDNGFYHCEAFNAVSNKSSAPYEVVVNYGPEAARITGPSMSLTEERVTFNCSATSQPPSQYMWFFNGSLVANASQYETDSLTLDMSGEYTCVAHNEITGRNSSAYKMLQVFAPVTMAEVKMVGAQPIVNHTFSLTCETNGSVDSIYWLRNGWPLSADSRRNLSQNNTILTFDPVLLSDNGHYQCHAYNPLSNMLSQNYSLQVIYGPETPRITGPSMSLTEERVTFNCSATSFPPSQYMWFFNGSLVANASQYETDSLTLDMSGEYTCVAHNEITGQNSSAYKMLQVFAPVTMAEVKMLGAQPIVNHTFSLTCETNGSVDSIYWLRNGWPLSADSRRNLSQNNTILTFDPVLLSDNGHYQCHAYNPLSNMLSQNYSLRVIYGPEDTSITGPKVVMAGRSANFTCSAASYPPSSYSWFFNGSLVANTSEYETGALMTNMSGTYTCTARNNISSQTSSAYTMLDVVEAIQDAEIEKPLQSAIEGDRYNLSCEVTGPVDDIHWLKDGRALDLNNRTTLSMDSKTVTFNPLELSDIGEYQCVAFNAVSNYSSAPYRLSMYYGPGVPTIYGPSIAEVGQTVTFDCSAMSLPPSRFSWFFDGSLVANTSHYHTKPLTLNMTGEYTCVAFNNVTQRNSTNSTMLTVIDGIQSVMVKNDMIPIDHKNLTLTCEIDGEYESVYWLKNNVQLNVSGLAKGTHVSHYVKNNSLHFNPVKLSDDGSYQCVATNVVGPHTSPKYELLVNYGPLSVNIKGPSSATVNSASTVTFECSADSRPVSKFKWAFNNQPLVPAISSNITIWVTPVHAGNYTCLAENPVTNITMSKTKTFTVTDRASAIPLQSRGGLMLMAVFAVSVPVINNWLFH